MIEDLTRSSLRGPLPPRARSLLVAGHRDGEELSLVIHIASETVAGFTDDDAAFAQGLVEVAALARTNARLYAQVRHAAERDSLTGLKNRRMYRAELAPLLAAATPQSPVTLAVVDVDDLKAINDAHGHDVGDRVLAHVADRLRLSARDGDEVYRIGGEEFAIVLPGASSADATIVAERIRRNLTLNRRDLEHVPTATVSIGLAVCPEHGKDIDELFRAARPGAA